MDGRCRTGARAVAAGECDAGLRCEPNTMSCRPALELGDPCDNSGVFNPCPAGASCEASAAGPWTCVAYGTRGARCAAVSGRLRCSEGFACAAGVCVVGKRPAGARCDDANDDPVVCAAGLRCVAAFGAHLCAADGAAGGMCRAAEPACDVPAACVATPSGRRCLAPLPRDANCARLDAACADGLRCADVGGGRRCVDAPAGTLASPCRATEPRCDDGGRCDASEFCRAPSTEGEVCVDDRGCASGLRCLLGRCASLGVDGRFCRETEPRCDEGLACLGPRCQRPPDGAPCGASADCGRGNRCVLGRCETLGAVGARCRSDAPSCDEGLRCGPEGRCIADDLTGATCSGDPVACGPERHCAGPSRCLRDGVEGGWCRVAAPTLCDPGLTCDAAGATPRCAPAP
jgi:hypothetical protein